MDGKIDIADGKVWLLILLLACAVLQEMQNVFLTLSVRRTNWVITSLEHQPSIIEHMHSILPSTRGAASVKVFHNVPHLDQTGSSSCLLVMPSCLDVSVNLCNIYCVIETHFYRFLCETVLSVEHVDTLVNCD